jgi:hypothetical protein
MTVSGGAADALRVFSYIVLAYFGVLTVGYLTVTLVSAVQVRSYFRRRSPARWSVRCARGSRRP